MFWWMGLRFVAAHKEFGDRLSSAGVISLPYRIFSPILGCWVGRMIVVSGNWRCEPWMGSDSGGRSGEGGTED